jgi:hypothetical protein
VGTSQGRYRPSVWEVVRIVALLGVIELINLTTHNDVLAAGATVVIYGAVVAWWFVRGNRVRRS